MKKFIFSLLALVVIANYTSAQKVELLVKSSPQGLYVEHNVSPKESFFSIGRLYNIHPKTIASFNNLDMNKGLLINQNIHIVLIDTNFSQQVNSGTPVYYKVGDKENLQTVSKKHKNVPLANLRAWNNLAKDNITENSKLIIGFLQSNELPAITISGKPKTTEPVAKTEEKPVVAKVKEETKEPVIKEEVKKVVPPIKKEETKTTATETGYFKNNFAKQVKNSPATKNETVTAGIFKTASGWQDAKYYLLIDNVSPGTIVKVINPANNKIVYAKVLGEMSGIRQNAGLDIRISNAAASVLEITEEDKFIVNVNY